MPLGMEPDSSGLYCSQTMSGASPPDDWDTSVALAVVMDETGFGCQLTLTFGCFDSYSCVNFCRLAFCGELMGPVLGGKIARIWTADPEWPPLLLPLHAAATRTAAVIAGSANILRVIFIGFFAYFLLVKADDSGSRSHGAHDDDGENEHRDEEDRPDRHSVAVFAVLEGRLV